LQLSCKIFDTYLGPTLGHFTVVKPAEGPPREGANYDIDGIFDRVDKSMYKANHSESNRLEIGIHCTQSLGGEYVR